MHKKTHYSQGKELLSSHLGRLHHIPSSYMGGKCWRSVKFRHAIKQLLYNPIILVGFIFNTIYNESIQNCSGLRRWDWS